MYDLCQEGDRGTHGNTLVESTNLVCCVHFPFAWSSARCLRRIL